jgi:hypothetical protein
MLTTRPRIRVIAVGRNPSDENWLKNWLDVCNDNGVVVAWRKLLGGGGAL